MIALPCNYVIAMEKGDKNLATEVLTLKCSDRIISLIVKSVITYTPNTSGEVTNGNTQKHPSKNSLASGGGSLFIERLSTYFRFYHKSMNLSEKQTHSQTYLERCLHPKIQALRPDRKNTGGVWIPTSEQLQQLLKQKLPYPDRSVFQRTAEGWEYQTYFRGGVGGLTITALILIRIDSSLEPMPTAFSCRY